MTFGPVADRLAWRALAVQRFTPFKATNATTTCHRAGLAFRRSFPHFIAPAAVACGLCLLVLTSSLSPRLIVPSDMVGGLHPATIEMLVGAAEKPV